MRCYLSIVLFSALVCACQPELPITFPQTNGSSISGARAAPDPGTLMDVTYRNQSFRVTKKDGLYYLSEDVILPKSEVSAEQAILQPKAAASTELTGVYKKYLIDLWPNNEVWYSLRGDAAGLQKLGPKVEKAIASWNDLKTGITFKHHSGIAPDKGLLVIDLSTANTRNTTHGLGFPGKDKPNLLVELRQEASATTILHELMHVVGVHHEHQRPIRDQVIRIDQRIAQAIGISPATIQSQFLNTFDVTIYTDRVVDTFPFDYKSITVYDTPGIVVNLFAHVTELKRSASLSQKDINLVRTIADYDMSVTKLIIRNENYPTLTAKVYLKGVGSKVFTLSAGGADIVFDYDLNTKLYTYMGHQVDYVDLNNDSYSDDIKFSEYSNRIAYRPNRVGDFWIIKNYNNPSPFSQETTNMLDVDGIAGKGPAVLKVSMTLPDAVGHGLLTYIKINKLN